MWPNIFFLNVCSFKGNEPWIFIGSTDAESEVPVLSLPYMKSWLTGKDPDAGDNWGVGGDRGWDG